jgi:hypothetical protein
MTQMWLAQNSSINLHVRWLDYVKSCEIILKHVKNHYAFYVFQYVFHQSFWSTPPRTAPAENAVAPFRPASLTCCSRNSVSSSTSSTRMCWATWGNRGWHHWLIRARFRARPAEKKHAIFSSCLNNQLLKVSCSLAIQLLFWATYILAEF